MITAQELRQNKRWHNHVLISTVNPKNREYKLIDKSPHKADKEGSQIQKERKCIC